MSKKKQKTEASPAPVEEAPEAADAAEAPESPEAAEAEGTEQRLVELEEELARFRTDAVTEFVIDLPAGEEPRVPPTTG